MEADKQLNSMELDAAIAERVMDLLGVERIGERLFYRNTQMAEEYGGTWSSPVPEYSTSIEAAMEVVEKMRSAGVWTKIQIFAHTTQAYVEMGVPSSECQEWGATTAEAICKCALKAQTKFELFADRIAALKAAGAE